LIMVQILPFKGLRYTTGPDLSAVTAPPYDVIDADYQQALYNQHPANVVRLILNQKSATDNAENSTYTRASHHLTQWMTEGTLALDDTPAVYAYSQQWTDAEGQTINRRGLIALLKLENLDSGHVLPHEYTLGGPKQDRFKLMQSTMTNLSQIFMVYEDPTRWVENHLFTPQAAAGPLASATDKDGVTHHIQPVTQPDLIAQTQALFASQTLLIADGHHRYETALSFKDTARQQAGNKAITELPTDYVMVFLSNLDDPGLQVYPTHRMLSRWEPLAQAELEQKLQETFNVVADTVEADFVYRTADKTWPLKVKASANLTAIPECMRQLDVALLDTLVFEGMMQQTANALKEAKVLTFHREADAPSRLLASGEAVAVFVMNTPRIKDIKAVCETGLRMPQKSTYFYPKIQSGLVLYPYFANAHGHTAHPTAPALPRALFNTQALLSLTP
jgi:uncharacterized protein (DUF1015 family)